MAGATVAPSLPAMEEHFHADLLVRLVLTLPALFIALAAPLAGWLADRFGRKNLLILSIVLYAVSGSVAFLADSLYTILVLRAVLGISVAGVITPATALISDYFSGNERSAFLGYQAAFMGFGGVLFLLAGGSLSEWTWRGPFLVYSAAVLILPFALSGLYEPDISENYHGAFPDKADELPKGLILFIYIFSFFGMVVFYLIPVQLPFYLKEDFQIEGTLSGASIGLATFVSSLTSLAFRKIRSRFAPPTIMGFIAFFMGIGFFLFGSASNLWQLWAGLVVTGFGFGMMLPNLNLWIAAVTPESFRGRVLGGLAGSIFLGQFFSPVLTDPLRGDHSLGYLYVLSAIFLTVTGLILLTVRKLAFFQKGTD